MVQEGEENETLTSTMLEIAIENLLFNMLLKNYIFRSAIGVFLHGKIMESLCPMLANKNSSSNGGMIT